ncbi:hypothetical protein KQ306_09970 [Synechococcus sp. CS-1324]|nr:hypothetical protein [Synechococcus sp. CS-1324]
MYGLPQPPKQHSFIWCLAKASALVLQQLGWWILRPPLLAARKLWQPQLDQPQPHLPRRLSLPACWLNAFAPDEVRTWMACGVSDWSQLKQRIPRIHSSAVHQRRRALWPEQCASASRLLADKAALLDLADASWRVPFLVLDDENSQLPYREEDHPWWAEALHGSGVVLKPTRGSACRDVVRFQSINGQLQSHVLFRAQPRSSGADPHGEDPRALLHHWRTLTQSNEPALAMPYLQGASILPPTSPTVVVRVITQQNHLNAPITVQCAWVELPLAEGSLALVTLNGIALPTPEPIRSSVEHGELVAWQSLLADPPPLIQSCLSLSVAMHQRLPPIDQVAWDWIPAACGPMLLEGNSGFSLLEPQLITEVSG